MKAIINGLVCIDEATYDDFIVVFDQKIRHILSKNDFHNFIEENSVEIIDAKGNYVLAGFIDVHIHGYKNIDTMDCSDSDLEKLQLYLTRNGVTSFLPTTMTMEKSIIEEALQKVSRVMKKKTKGAEIIGVHLEGPFISAKYKGAQSDEYIIKPDFDLIEKYQDIIKIVTIAPEVDGAIELIKKYSDKINFSIGHTNATADEASLAISSGANSFTHLFNAMTPLNHRNIGAVGTALTTDSYAELICDNFHVSKTLYNLVIKAKGLDKILLVTDCIRAGGLSDGEYNLGGQNVFVKDGKCLLEDGTIAGSTLKLNDAFKNFTNATGLSVFQTISAVTSNQAKYLGIFDEVGDISVNKRADFVIINDKFEIIKTITKGGIAYEI